MKLIPVDKQQCQAEHQVGAFSFGGQIGKRTRCTNKPTVTIKERKAAADGLAGSMSLCDTCLQNAYKQLGKDFFTVTKIAAPEKRRSRKSTRTITQQGYDAISCLNTACGWNDGKGRCGLVRCCPGRHKTASYNGGGCLVASTCPSSVRRGSQRCAEHRAGA